jgi:hypothetical protein
MRCAMQSPPEETNDSLYKALLSHKQQANSRLQSSPEETNDSLYKALLSHKQQANSRQQSIAGSIKSLNEANAMRRTQAEDAPSVVTASTHYQSNARSVLYPMTVTYW